MAEYTRFDDCDADAVHDVALFSGYQSIHDPGRLSTQTPLTSSSASSHALTSDPKQQLLVLSTASWTKPAIICVATSVLLLLGMYVGPQMNSKAAILHLKEPERAELNPRTIEKMDNNSENTVFDGPKLDPFLGNDQQLRSQQLGNTLESGGINSAATPEITAEPATTDVQEGHLDMRRRAIRNAMKHAWSNYEQFAFGGDEINPLTGENVRDRWGGIAMTMVDGIDTLWVMDLKDEFQRARDFIATKLDFSQMGRDGRKFSVFETTIREVGGLLSAYELSRDNVFKQKAQQLVDLLTPAFDPSKGVFYTLFNPYTKEKSFQPWAHHHALLADVGTLQLELRYLSSITNDPKYAEMGDAFYAIVQREGSFNQTGLFPVDLDVETGHFASQETKLTFGALGDSFYEYLLKVWIRSGRRPQDSFLRKLYDEAIEGLDKHLLVYSSEDHQYYLQDAEIPSLKGIPHMQHLACFVPGTLALGTLFDQDIAKNVRHLDIAKKLMETCYEMYHHEPTGLSPDDTDFPGLRPRDPHYPLRPEVVESLTYLYRVTKDPKYREYGWTIFQSIEKYCKTSYGYAAINDVTKVPPPLGNRMESFFLAETLKYHFLLQSEDSVVPLDKYVFNTESHPLGIQPLVDDALNDAEELDQEQSVQRSIQ